jgi:hypothetical protein
MFTLSPKAKQKFGRFKNRLHQHGFAPSVASESTVVERLISEAASGRTCCYFGDVLTGPMANDAVGPMPQGAA